MQILFKKKLSKRKNNTPSIFIYKKRKKSKNMRKSKGGLDQYV